MIPSGYYFGPASAPEVGGLDRPMQQVRERENYDLKLLIIAMVLLCGGLAIVLDASFARAIQSKASGYDPYFFFKKQAMWSGLTVLVMLG